MYREKIIKKVPGNIPAPSKKEGQGYIEDLSSKQLFELEELFERQNKLLNNKVFVSRLPDKGDKIKNFRDRIEREIRSKNEIENAANLLSRLNIASEGKAAMNELEWTGKYSDNDDNKGFKKTVQLDSDDDDDDEDPLKILAQPTGSGVHKKKVVILSPEESLVRPEDIEDIDEISDKPQSQAEHVRYITEMAEKTREIRESFKPYKTTKSNVHDPGKEIGRKRDKHWEITAATPPPSIHGTVKSLSIEESLKLQKEQAEKLREIQTRHAFTRLADQMGTKIGDKIPSIVGSFRTPAADSSSSNSEDEEENEVHDEDDTDKGGTVVFTVKG